MATHIDLHLGVLHSDSSDRGWYYRRNVQRRRGMELDLLLRGIGRGDDMDRHARQQRDGDIRALHTTRQSDQDTPR